LPEFLPQWSVGAPSIRVLLHVLIGQDPLKGSTSVIEFHNVLSQKSIILCRGHEELIDHIAHAFAHGNSLWRRWSCSSCNNHPTSWQNLVDPEPSSVKEIVDDPTVCVGHD